MTPPHGCRFDVNYEGHRYLISLLAAKDITLNGMDPWVRETLDSIPGTTVPRIHKSVLSMHDPRFHVGGKFLSWMEINRAIRKDTGTVFYRTRVGEGTKLCTRAGDRVRLETHAPKVTPGKRYSAEGS